MDTLQNALHEFSNQHFQDGAKRRIHISVDPIQRFIKKRKQKIDRKPKGLWFGIDDSWISWSLENYFMGCNHIYEVILDEEKILRIDNWKDFLEFEKEYEGIPEWKKSLEHFRREREFDLQYPEIAIHARRFTFCDHIDFPRFAQKYRGIEISPFRYERHLESPWYYGWDCASGCVWGGVKELKLLASYNEEFGRFDLQP